MLVEVLRIESPDSLKNIFLETYSKVMELNKQLQALQTRYNAISERSNDNQTMLFNLAKSLSPEIEKHPGCVFSFDEVDGKLNIVLLQEKSDAVPDNEEDFEVASCD